MDFDRFALTPALIAEAAQNGDQVAMEVFEETGYYLGLCVVNLINVLNPEMIVIGGGIAQAGELILEPIGGRPTPAPSAPCPAPAGSCRRTWATMPAFSAAPPWSCKARSNYGCAMP